VTSASYVFDRFTLDIENRTLRRDGAPVEINARYLDALILLVSEAGKLITKDRFLQEVWRGVPVTDEALTQCVKTLRRQLGDDAAQPRFIVTVPKHGYRFIGSAELSPTEPDHVGSTGPSEPHDAAPYSWRDFFALGGAGTLGAGGAGIAGGLFYGSILASQQPETGAGGASVVIVLLWLTMMAAVVGGAGVSFGIAAAGFARARGWSIVGGALGGLVIGGLAKLLGLDAFSLLLGQSPGDITGAPEGLLLGASVGLGVWLSGRMISTSSIRRSISIAGITGCVGAIAILLLGGKLMGGSLDLLAGTFPESRLNLDRIGRIFGESEFGPVTQLTTGALEGALFGGCIVGAMCLARRTLIRDRAVGVAPDAKLDARADGAGSSHR